MFVQRLLNFRENRYANNFQQFLQMLFTKQNKAFCAFRSVVVLSVRWQWSRTRKRTESKYSRPVTTTNSCNRGDVYYLRQRNRCLRFRISRLVYIYAVAQTQRDDHVTARRCTDTTDHGVEARETTPGEGACRRTEHRAARPRPGNGRDVRGCRDASGNGRGHVGRRTAFHNDRAEHWTNAAGQQTRFGPRDRRRLVGYGKHRSRGTSRGQQTRRGERVVSFARIRRGR